MGMTREKAIKNLQFVRNALNGDMEIAKAYDMAIKALEQEPQTFEWCTDCKEYDQEKHCCHRFSKVIRDTVEEMKQEQEPILDKIRAEIEQYQSDYDVHGIEYDRTAWKAFNRCLQIIDKYKAESEVEDDLSIPERN